MALIDIPEKLIYILEETGYLEKVFDYFRGNQTVDVLVIGPSGAGKTSFANGISGLTTFIEVEDRSKDREDFTGKLKGLPVHLVTVPGQDEGTYKRNREATISELAQSPNLGVINLVSYGFNEIPKAKADLVFDENGSVQAGFLNDQLKLEEKLSRSWSKTLCGRGKAARWIITAVNKADLWYGTELHAEVDQYYQSNRYFKTLGRGADLPHVVTRSASNPQPFYESFKMSGLYSEQQRQDDYNEIITQILRLTSRYGLN